MYLSFFFFLPKFNRLVSLMPNCFHLCVSRSCLSISLSFSKPPPFSYICKSVSLYYTFSLSLYLSMSLFLFLFPSLPLYLSPSPSSLCICLPPLFPFSIFLSQYNAECIQCAIPPPHTPSVSLGLPFSLYLFELPQLSPFIFLSQQSTKYIQFANLIARPLKHDNISQIYKDHPYCSSNG